VRELENVIYRSAVIAQGDAILVKDLPAEIGGANAAAAPGPEPAANLVSVEPAPELAPPEAPSLANLLDAVYAQLAATEKKSLLARLEREMVARALAAHPGDVMAAAKLLGLTKTALQQKAKKR
jgi:two-component system nitrogen regulation response regulator GlnG